MDYSAQIQNWIGNHQNKIVELLKEFVSIPSVVCYNEDGTTYGKACHAMADCYQQTAETLGFHTERYADDAVVVYESFDPNKKTIGIWTHLDVVPAGKDWETDPFMPTVRDGYLIGRGSDDNKSAAAGALAILLCLRELKIPTECNIQVFASCDEECGSLGVIRYTQDHVCPDFSLVPDCGFPVCYGEKGIMNLTVRSDKALTSEVLELCGGTVSNMIPDNASILLKRTNLPDVQLPEYASVVQEQNGIRIVFTGVSGHAASPSGSVNAIDRLLTVLSESCLLSENDREILSSIHKLFLDNDGTALGIAGEDEISGKTSCAGTILSLQDGHVCLGFNIRYCISADSNALHEAAERSCAKQQCQICNFHDSKPNYFDPASPVIEKLTEVFFRLSGSDKKPYVMSGGTYARKLPNAVGFGIGGLPRTECPFLKKGHGGAHQPNEVLHLETYFKALWILICGVLTVDPVIARNEKNAK